MSQDEVEQFLRQNSPKRFTAKQMCKQFKLSQGTISLNARRLVKWGRIEVYQDQLNRCFYSIPLPTGHSHTKDLYK
jgi:DNA-binding MarR family transcriptional regulator